MGVFSGRALWSDIRHCRASSLQNYERLFPVSSLLCLPYPLPWVVGSSRAEPLARYSRLAPSRSAKFIVDTAESRKYLGQEISFIKQPTQLFALSSSSRIYHSQHNHNLSDEILPGLRAVPVEYPGRPRTVNVSGQRHRCRTCSCIETSLKLPDDMIWREELNSCS